MKTRFIFISILAIMTAACAESEWEPASQTDVSTSTHSVRQRTLDEALAYADEWFAQMDEPTRSEGRRVGNVEYVRSTTRTRAGDTDTLMYLVNYEDNRGFALLGRPATSKAIYAISEEGSLDMSDTIYNKPLAMFMASAREDANDLIPNPTLPPVTFPGDNQRPKRHIIREVKPMLPDNVAKWSQSYPYNFFCDYYEEGHRGYVGCGPLSVGMLMAFYKRPTKLGNTTYDWDRIIKDNLTLVIADFLDKLASPEYLNSKYLAWNNRYTPILNIRIPFAKLGYGLGDVWNATPLYTEKGDNIQALMDFMQRGTNNAKAAPVILWGQSVEAINEKYPGHIWVTDGFVEAEELNPNFPEITPKKLDPLLHLIWGWGGKANGYYTYLKSKKRFTTIDASELDSGMPDMYGSILLFGKYITFND